MSAGVVRDGRQMRRRCIRSAKDFPTSEACWPALPLAARVDRPGESVTGVPWARAGMAGFQERFSP